MEKGPQELLSTASPGPKGLPKTKVALRLGVTIYKPSLISFIWRSQLYFLPTFVWGLKQANNNAQRVTSALAAAHRSTSGFNVQVNWT